MKISHEEWRAIPGFLGYECSDFGRVRSFKRRGKGGLTNIPHIMTKSNRPNGYRFVTLSREGKIYPKSVHILVMLTFVGPRPKGMEIAHNNGDRADNALLNLRYCTKIENEMDKIRHGTSRRQFTLTSDIVKRLRKECSSAGEGKRFSIIRKYADLLDVSVGTLYDAARGETWKHITDPPPTV